MRMRLLLAAAVVCVISASVRGDAGGCQEFAGDFTSTLVPPPTCTSPVGLCTHGVLTGEVDGTYDFTITELVCGPDPGDPGDPLKQECTYAGDSVVTTEKGSIITADTGVMHIVGTDATFTTTAAFLSGTRRYENASGVFVATGELDFVTGEAVGVYSLEVCHGN